MKANKNQSFFFHATCIVFLLGLSGCGSDSDDNSSHSSYSRIDPEVVSFAAQSVSFATDLQPLYQVDLSDAIFASDSGRVQVIGIDNLSGREACEPVAITESGFSVQAGQYGACDYRYYIGRPDTEAKSSQIKSATAAGSTLLSNDYGVARIAITPASISSVELPPVTYHTTIKTTTEAIDVRAALAAIGHPIDSDFKLSFSGCPFNTDTSWCNTTINNNVVVNVSDDTLTYTPPSDFQGIERLLFSYQDTPGNVKLGVLDIAVAHNVSLGIEINADSPDNHIIWQNTIWDSNIGNESHTIDISSYVSSLSSAVSGSADCSDYHLVYIDVFNALVDVGTYSGDYNNKLFDFTPSAVGTYYVSFAVSDHCGTYEMGLIEITVGEPSTPDWQDIELSWMQLFTAPKTKEELDAATIHYSGSLTDTNYKPDAANVAAFNASDAADYCDSLDGRVPSATELTALYTGKPQEVKSWPTLHNYLVTDGSDYYQFSLDSGSVTSTTVSALHQVSCIKEGTYTVKPVGTRCAAPGDTIDYTITLANHSQPLNEWVEVALSSEPIAPAVNTTANLISNSGSSDNYFTNNGQFPFSIANSAPDEEVVDITATYGKESAVLNEKAYFGFSNISATIHAFASVEPSGKVVVWGHTNAGGSLSVPEDVSSQLGPGSGVKEIYAAGYAFAALKENGSVVTWGESRFGGDSSAVSSQLASEVEEIFSNREGFAALKKDGTVVVWGHADGSGSIPAGVSSQLNSGSKVERIYSTGYAFAALKEDGTVITWGDANKGGSLAVPVDVTSELGSGSTVKEIYGTDTAFAALKADGTVVTWGGADNGGSIPLDIRSELGSGSDIQKIYATNGAFAALKGNGKVVAWGNSASGGSLNVPADVSSELGVGSDIKEIYASGAAFAALKGNGKVVLWGNDTRGASPMVPVDVSSKLGPGSNIKKIYPAESAFAALKLDGEVVTWGHHDWGGSLTMPKDVSSQLGPNSGVIDIVGYIRGGLSFSALKEDGSVVSWGYYSSEGVEFCE